MWADWTNQHMGLSSSFFKLVINPIRNPKEKPNVHLDAYPINQNDNEESRCNRTNQNSVSAVSQTLIFKWDGNENRLPYIKEKNSGSALNLANQQGFVEEWSGYRKGTITVAKIEGNMKVIPTLWVMTDVIFLPSRNMISLKGATNVTVKWENASIQCVHSATTNCALMVAGKRIQVLNITRNSRSNWDSTAIEEMVKENKLIYSFDLTKTACFGVLPRYAKDEQHIRWFELPNCFLYANAWEEEDEVVLITCCLENFFGAQKVEGCLNLFEEATTNEKHEDIGNTLWTNKPLEAATAECKSDLHGQFSLFGLEDKALSNGDSIDRNVNVMDPETQPKTKKWSGPIIVYKRRGKNKKEGVTDMEHSVME